MKKFIVIAFMALAVTMIATVPAKASDVTPTEDPSPTPSAMPNPYSKLIVRSDGSINMSNVYDAYRYTLTNDQRNLCNYLIGLSNYMYLTARGFKYETVTTGAELVSMLASFGARFFDVTPVEFSSRVSAYMQNFVSACVSYAGTVTDINGNLGDWIDDHQNDLYIPYTSNALTSWTQYYNDPSNLGVVNWGNYNSPWESGTFYDFAFANIQMSSSSQNEMNNFILDYSPVIYTNNIIRNNRNVQTLLGEYNFSNLNTLYVLRSQTEHGFKTYRFGNFENGLYPEAAVSYLVIESDASNAWVTANNGFMFRNKTFTIEETDIFSLIESAFYNTPFYGVQSWLSDFKGFYPYISHVVLVDNITTLSNPEEIFFDFSFNINDDNAKWIQTPNGQVLYYPIGSGAILKEFPLPEDLKKDDGQGNLISIDPTKDLVQEVVNNTVINNYQIIAPGSIINVPVDWLEGEGNYLEYTNNIALPFFVMIGDIFNALGEIRIFIVAVLILGLAGGVLVKFLL